VEIIDYKKVEDCLDGTLIRELLLNSNITKDFIFYLGQMGTLQYFPDFIHPFFKIDGKDFKIKGIEDNKTLRVTLTDEAKMDTLKVFIQKYQNNKDD